MKNIFSICLIICSLFVFSQKKINISGTVTEKQSKQTIPYVNILFTNVNNKNEVFAGFSDEKGKFKIEINQGKYIITSEQVGFKDFSTEMELNQDKQIDLIKLEPLQDTKLEEVTVTTSKPIYQVQLDKKIYDVTQDLTAKAGNLSDVMQNVPSVSVDADGSLSVRGNTDVTILIDGKPSSLLGINNPSDALKMIPSENVAKIEVITNASSRYQAQGTGGIINIILKKDKKSGINGSIELFTGEPANHGFNLRLGYNHKKWNFFTNSALRYNENKGNSTVKFSQTNSQKEIIKRTFQKGNNINYNTSLIVGGGLTYDFNEKNKLGFSTNINKRWKNTSNNIEYNDYDFISEPNYLLTRRLESGNGESQGIDLNSDYTLKLNKDGEELTFNTTYQYSEDNNDSSILENQYIPSFVEKTQNKTGNKNNQNTYMFKSDYVLPITDKSKFEAGFRFDSKQIQDDFFVSERNIILEPFTNLTNYKDYIYAGYTQYANKINKFSYLLGLRFEHSNVNVKAKNNNLEINKNYSDLFPTLHLNYDITENNQLQFSYSRKIFRPFGRFLTPYFGYTDSRNIFQGNPDLNPSYSSSFELGYNIQAENKKYGITPSLYYQHVTDDLKMVVTRISGETLGFSNDLLITQPNNIGTNQKYGAELSFNLSFVRWMRWFGEFNFFGYKNTGTYSYLDLISNTNRNISFDSEGFAWGARLNGTFKLPKSFDLQLQSNYRSTEKAGQSERKPFFVFNLGLSKELLNKKASIAFNIKDVFNTRSRNYITYDENYTRDVLMQWQERQFNLSFTYRFNKPLQRNKNDQRMQEEQMEGGF